MTFVLVCASPDTGWRTTNGMKLSIISAYIDGVFEPNMALHGQPRELFHHESYLLINCYCANFDVWRHCGRDGKTLFMVSPEDQN